MITPKKEEIGITSTIEGEKVAMRIDEEAHEHIIALLTDLYSDPETAIVREISTNALDAHVESGQTRPIEVSTPTTLSPVLKIQDWGTGLNAEDIREIYSLYGRSTKTDTNEQVGSLGLGCKSPLTYTNQFTVVGTKDGVKTSIMVSRDEDGIPIMEIVNESETDDPNGVTVIVPCKVYNNIEAKARKIFRFWDPGTVLVNGEEPQHYEGLKINDDITLVEDQGGYGRSFLIMGNVPYPIDDSYLNDMDLQSGQIVIMRVPLGTVHFTPSREQLHYTKRTQRVIAELVERYKADLLQAAQDDIDKAETRALGMKRAVAWRKRIPKSYLKNFHFSYREEEIPEEIKCPGEELARFQVTSGEDTRNNFSSNKLSRVENHKVIKIGMVPQVLWVYNFDRNFTATCKKKLWMYCDEKGLDYPEQFILSAKRSRNKWLDKSRFIDWHQVNKLKLPRTQVTKSPFGRLQGSYDIVIGSTPHLQTEVDPANIDTRHPVFYADTNIEATTMASRLRELNVFDDFTIAVVYPNRLAKFKRLFPDTRNVSSIWSEIYRTYLESLSDVQRQAITLQRSGVAKLRLVRKHEILDPEIKHFVRLATLNVTHELDTLRKFSYLDRKTNEVDDPFDKYPLFKTTYAYGDEKQLRLHNTIYINAAWKELYANG